MKKFIAGFFLASVLSFAAPFNMQTTRRADLAFVDSMRVFKLADGGVGYQPNLVVPTEQTLPDGGLRTVNDSAPTGQCEVTNATVRTNVLSFMNNQGLMCGRVTADLEQ